MKKNIKIFLALLITVAVIGTVYFLGIKKNNAPIPAQTSDQTANWKTYTNNKLGIQFDYSPSLSVSEEDSGNRILVPYAMGYIFEVKSYITKDDIATWWSKDPLGTKNIKPSPYIQTQSTFNNKPAYFFKQNDPHVQVTMDMYAVQMNGQILTITYETPFNLSLYSGQQKDLYAKANDDFNKNIKPLIDQILSSFKFTQ